MEVPPSLLTPVRAELPNGLRVRLLPDPTADTIAYQTFFRVGSRNERVGRTGVAHLFEHLMFNGATRWGPKEFDRAIEAQGGHSNAYTSWDVTAYHEEAPAAAFELFVDLEVDRMGGLRLTADSLASEREVVKEERRQSVDDSVMGVLDEQLQSLVFRAHPYRWPIIGFAADLDRLSLDDLRDFFARHYAPNNATLYVAGRFDADAALKRIESAYAALPRGPATEPPPSDEPVQKGARRARVLHPVQTAEMAVAFLGPNAADPRSAACDLLQAVLGFGDGSTLVKSLVHRQELCTDVEVDFAWRIDRGPFSVWMGLPPGGDLERAEAALWKELEKMAARGPEPARLARAKTQMEVAQLRELATCSGRAHAVANAEHLLGLEDVRGLFERIRAVTPRQVRDAARELFRRERSCVVFATP